MRSHAIHLGGLVERAREAKGIGRTDLVKLLGYKNTSKGLRRLDDLEKRGKAHADLITRLSAILDIDDTEIQRAIEWDQADEHAAWEAWADVPVPITMQVKPFAGFYITQPLPEDVADDPDGAEVYARQFAREHGVRVCLAVSRREAVWIGADGEVYGRDQAKTGAPVGPRMSIRGKAIAQSPMPRSPRRCWPLSRTSEKAYYIGSDPEASQAALER